MSPRPPTPPTARRDHRRPARSHLQPRRQLLRRRLLHLHPERRLDRDRLDHGHLRRRPPGRQRLRHLAEDAGATAIDVLANDTDIDGGPKVGLDRPTAAHGTVAITGGEAGAHLHPRRRLLRRRLLHLHPERRLDAPPSRSRSPASTTRRSPSTTPRPSPRTRAATAIDVLANDTDTDAGPKPIDRKPTARHGTVAIIGGGDPASPTTPTPTTAAPTPSPTP